MIKISIYNSIYNLLVTYVFGGAVSVGTHQELVCILLSTIAVVYLVTLPFLIVWKVIRLIVG